MLNFDFKFNKAKKFESEKEKIEQIPNNKYQETVKTKIRMFDGVANVSPDSLSKEETIEDQEVFEENPGRLEKIEKQRRLGLHEKGMFVSDYGKNLKTMKSNTPGKWERENKNKIREFLEENQKN